MYLHVKPERNKKVLDPATGKALPVDGARVADSPYWRRRLGDKDVVRFDPPKAASGADKPAKKKEG